MALLQTYVLLLLTFSHSVQFVLSSQSEDFLSDTVHTVLNSVQGIVGNLQDFVGDKSGCKFTCPDGSKPRPNYYHRPSSNGCGAFGIQLDSEISVKAVSKCCDEHDICYDICNNKKKDCDKDFKICLQSVCEKAKKILSKDLYKGCKTTVDIMYAGTVALGCKPYKDAQKKACICQNRYEL